MSGSPPLFFVAPYALTPLTGCVPVFVAWGLPFVAGNPSDWSLGLIVIVEKCGETRVDIENYRRLNSSKRRNEYGDRPGKAYMYSEFTLPYAYL